MNALLVEGIHEASGISRNTVHTLINNVEQLLDSVSHDLERKLGAVLGGGSTDKDMADSVMAIASAPADRETNRAMIRLVAGVVGMVWGTSILNVGLSTTTGIVALGLGIEVAPVFAILLGILIMFYCGRYTLGVISELLSRLSSFNVDK